MSKMATILYCGGSVYPLFANLTSDSYFLPTFTKTQKAGNTLFVVQFQRRKRDSKLRQKTIQGPPTAKRPPTTDRAEQLTLIRGSRPIPPTTATALSSFLPTMSRTTDEIYVCYGLLAAHSPLYRLEFVRTTAQPRPAGI